MNIREERVQPLSTEGVRKLLCQNSNQELLAGENEKFYYIKAAGGKMVTSWATLTGLRAEFPVAGKEGSSNILFWNTHY